MLLFHYDVFKKLISDYNCEKDESNKVNSNDKLNYKEKNIPGKFFINSKTKQNLNGALSGNKSGQLPCEKLCQVDFSNESKIENPIEIFFSPESNKPFLINQNTFLVSLKSRPDVQSFRLLSKHS